MQQPQGRPLKLRLLAFLWMAACGGESATGPEESSGKSSEGGGASVRLPREWTPVDRATPELAGRFGPHDWRLCRGKRPCEATTWSPLDYSGERPRITVLVTEGKAWQTDGEPQRWRARWTWVDPLLAACLGDGLSLYLDSPRIDRTLVEHEDGFWWTFSLDGAGPCDLRGGIELSATADKGRSTRLVAGGQPWGSPGARGFASDVLRETYGPAPGQP
jgi:hypothetical protein